MRLILDDERLLEKLELGIFTNVNLLCMYEDGDVDWGHCYRDMLRSFRHHHATLFIETIASIEACIDRYVNEPHILACIAQSMALSGVQREYVDRSSRDYLVWVLGQMKEELEHPSYDPDYPYGK